MAIKPVSFEHLILAANAPEKIPDWFKVKFAEGYKEPKKLVKPDLMKFAHKNLLKAFVLKNFSNQESDFSDSVIDHPSDVHDLLVEFLYDLHYGEKCYEKDRVSNCLKPLDWIFNNSSVVVELLNSRKEFDCQSCVGIQVDRLIGLFDRHFKRFDKNLFNYSVAIATARSMRAERLYFEWRAYFATSVLDRLPTVNSHLAIQTNGVQDNG